MTAEQAGDQLTGYATNLLNQAADDFLANAQNPTEKLADYARDQTFTIEQRIFNDVQTITLNCIVRCSAWIPYSSVNKRYLTKMLTNGCSAYCLAESQESDTSKLPERTTGFGKHPYLAVGSSYYICALWRCTRLAYVDLKRPSTAIRDAFDDVVSNGAATMCALHTDADVALRRVTEIWIDDTQSAKAGDRAIRGERELSFSAVEQEWILHGGT